MDCWGYCIISLGFIFLMIGIILGVVWVNEAWGLYWNWDLKEIWVFIIWIIFVIYLYIRKNKKLEDLNFLIVVFIGFFIIWVCYLGINSLGIGLYSYGSFI
ncbi:c-type cytochrome biogenesis protein CcsB, partial [Pseudomonas putida]